MAKLIEFNTEVRTKMKAGIDILANAVKVTLGPKGRNVIISRQDGYPHVTKDGVTVAKSVELSDPFENMGAQMIKEVAANTAEEAGDGTTSSTVLAQAIINEGIKNIAAGANPMDLKRGIDKAVDTLVKELKNISSPVKDNKQIAQIGTISANNDSFIGELIADAVAKVGNDGVITVEEAKGMDTEVKVVEGLQFDRGYISPYFATDTNTMEAVLDSPYILITNARISTMANIMHIVGPIVQNGNSILLIAEDVDGEAINTLVVNKIRGKANIAAVRAPGFGEKRRDYLQDIAILTGGTLIAEELGNSFQSSDISILGQAEKVIITNTTTTIIGGKGDKQNIEDRINSLKSQYEITQNTYEKTKIKERIGKLSGGIAVLYVGATTEVELKEKKDRIDDALCATRAAIEEGVVAGGGVTFVRLSKSLKDVSVNNDDEATGVKIVAKAIEEPLRQIAKNAGVDGSVIIRDIFHFDNNVGYNAYTDEYVDMYDNGIIDPAKVLRVSLQNAASVAGMFLTTECGIVEE